MRYGRRHLRRGYGMGHLWWHGRLKGSGYRITVPREEILNVLSNTGEHLSAEEIYMKVHKTYPGLGLTTVYRTLELLEEMGIVIRIAAGDGRARYELAEGPKGRRHHHHLICTKCGKVIDYTDFIEDEKELIGKTEEGLSKKYKFKILNHEITFYGLCEACK